MTSRLENHRLAWDLEERTVYIKASSLKIISLIRIWTNLLRTVVVLADEGNM